MTAPITTRLHFVVSGTLPNGEVWATGWWETTDTPISNATLAARQATTTFQTWKQVVLGLMSTASRLTTLTCYQYAGAGTAATNVAQVAVTGATQGSGGGDHPNQTAMCLSLRSELATARGRGRMFLPANGAAIAAGLFTASVVLDIITRTAAMLAEGEPIVWSPTSSTAQYLTRVQSDTIPDTIRARRDAVRVAPQSVPVA